MKASKAAIAVEGPIPKRLAPARAEPRVETLHLVFSASTIIAFFYVLRLDLAVESEALWKQYFLKEHGFLERMEAVVWLAAVVLNAGLVVWALRRSTRIALLWFASILALSVFALGEEVSWGQYVFGVQPGEFMMKHNVQQDITLHNLDFAGFLGLEEGWLRSAFLWLVGGGPYLLCIALWIGLPLARRTGRVPLLERLPLPSDSVVIFFAANIVLYAVVDVAIADVAEIWELAIAMTFALAAFDLWQRRESPEAALPERMAA